jgi:hypothetical protein
MKNGKPIIHVKFDTEEYEREIEKFAAEIPRASDIIDQEALDLAMEGVPEKDFEKALNAAIKAQIDDYNNTPRDDLGGLTPSEMFRRGKRSRD